MFNLPYETKVKTFRGVSFEQFVTIEDDMHMWCNEQFGKDRWGYKVDINPGIRIYKFAKENDKLLFELTWK